MQRFRERLVRHVEIEIVVLGAAVVVVAGDLVIVVRAVDEVHGRRRLLTVEAVVHVAMGVREPREEHARAAASHVQRFETMRRG